MVKHVALFLASVAFGVVWVLALDHMTGAVTYAATQAVHAYQDHQASSCTMLIDQDACLDTSHITDSRHHDA